MKLELQQRRGKKKNHVKKTQLLNPSPMHAQVAPLENLERVLRQLTYRKMQRISQRIPNQQGITHHQYRETRMLSRLLSQIIPRHHQLPVALQLKRLQGTHKDQNKLMLASLLRGTTVIPKSVSC